MAGLTAGVELTYLDLDDKISMAEQPNTTRGNQVTLDVGVSTINQIGS